MRFIIATLLTFLSVTSYGQNVAINNTGSTPDPSAMLDVQSSSKGMLVPRMTSAQRNIISNPAVGLLVYDTNEGSFWFYNGTSWLDLSDPQKDDLTDGDGDTRILVDNGFDNDKIDIEVAGQNYIEMAKDAMGYTRMEIKNTNQNIMIGDRAGEKLITGNFGNTVIGSNAFVKAPGGRNTILGHLAGHNMTFGSHNTLIGQEAGYLNTGGDFNTMLGRRTGRNVTTGNYNLFLGYGAGAAEAGDHKLHIHNSTTSSPTNSLIYGEFDTGLLRVNGELQVKNQYAFPQIDGSAGQVMSTDGSGNLNWITPASGGSTDEIQDADGDTRIQVEEGADDDKIRFDIGGTEHLVIQKNSDDISRLEMPQNVGNVNIGGDAGKNLDPSSIFGRNNVLIGEKTGEQLSTGYDNVLIGLNAGNASTAGYGNTLIGADAGKVNTGNHNTIIGHEAGMANVSGGQNIMIGRKAGFNNNKSNNIFIGPNAAPNNNGSGNIFIGQNVATAETGNNKLYIDNSSTTAPLIKGDFFTNELEFNGQTDFNGDTEINGDAQVNGTLNINNAYDFPTTAGTVGQQLEVGAGGNLTWGTGGGGSSFWQMRNANGGIEPTLTYPAVCLECPGNNINLSTLAIGTTGPINEMVHIESSREYALRIHSNYIDPNNTADGAIRMSSINDSKTATLFVTNADDTEPAARIYNYKTGYALDAYSFLGDAFVATSAADNTVAGNFSSQGYNGYGIVVNAAAKGVDVNVSGTGSATFIGGHFKAHVSSVNGTGVRGEGSDVGVVGDGDNFDFYAVGPGTNYGAGSSRRWKTDIRNIDNAVDKLKRLRGVYYTWNEEHGGKHDIGFIAEEIAEQLPEIVVFEANGIDVKGLDYSKTTPLILEALRAHIVEYEEKVQLLETKLEAQQELIESLMGKAEK